MQPIYRSDGEWVGVFFQGHLFNIDGEWIGFVDGRDVYNPGGQYLGYLSNDRRLLRKRTESIEQPPKTPRPRPPRPSLPSGMPLAPMMRALPYGIIDLFEEFPDQLLYISDTRPDME